MLIFIRSIFVTPFVKQLNHFHMKKISYTALFAGMVLLAGAQNTPQMSEEEKLRTLEGLERSYEMEIYGYFSNNSPATVLDIMPWEEWA